MVPLKLITRLHNIVEKAFTSIGLKERNDVYVRNNRIYSEYKNIKDTAVLKKFKQALESLADKEGFKVEVESDIAYFDLD